MNSTVNSGIFTFNTSQFQPYNSPNPLPGLLQSPCSDILTVCFLPSFQCLCNPSKKLPLTTAGQSVPIYTLSSFPVFFPSKNSTLSYVLNHVSYLYFAAFLKLSQSPGRFMKRQITGPHPPAKSFRFSSSRRGLRISISNHSQVMRILLVHGSHFEKHCLAECELLESRAIMF